MVRCFRLGIIEGRYIGDAGFRDALRTAAERVGVYRTRDDERIYPRPHDLPHTYASWQVQAGASLYKVQ